MRPIETSLVPIWDYRQSAWKSGIEPQQHESARCYLADNKLTLADPGRGRTRRPPPQRPRTYDFFMPKTLNFLIFFLRSLRSRFISSIVLIEIWQ